MKSLINGRDSISPKDVHNAIKQQENQLHNIDSGLEMLPWKQYAFITGQLQNKNSVDWLNDMWNR